MNKLQDQRNHAELYIYGTEQNGTESYFQNRCAPAAIRYNNHGE